mgnify:FL=1
MGNHTITVVIWLVVSFRVRNHSEEHGTIIQVESRRRAPVAQGIERSPPKREVPGSNPGRGAIFLIDLDT